jgi:hypothetical protein
MTDLAEQINAAHQQVLGAFDKSRFDAAIKAGELLNQAKKEAKARRIKWEDWLDKNCSEIGQRTARVYQRLATHKRELNWQRAAKLMGEELSIRGALKLIPPTRVRPARTAATKAAIEPPPPPKSPTTIEAVLSDLAPDELFKAVTETWDNDQIADLTARLKEYLNERGVPPPPPTVQPGLRRV